MAKRSGAETREKLLDAAEGLINRQGFAATSIDQILERVGATKGTFFYHFASKQALADALIRRFAAQDRAVLASCVDRSRTLADDPVQRLDVFVGLLLEVAEVLDGTPEPGCLFATYCFESGLFDPATNDVIADAIRRWRDEVGALIRAAAEQRSPRVAIDADSLADMLTVIFEGAFVLSRTVGGGSVFGDQLRHYRRYLRLLFGEDAA